MTYGIYGAEKILGAPNKKRKTTEPLMAPTNPRSKGFRMQKKRKLIRGPMSGQLHQRRRRTSNNLANPGRHFPPPWSVEEQTACFVVRP
jgi:hypothetical protein